MFNLQATTSSRGKALPKLDYPFSYAVPKRIDLLAADITDPWIPVIVRRPFIGNRVLAYVKSAPYGRSAVYVRDYGVVDTKRDLLDVLFESFSEQRHEEGRNGYTHDDKRWLHNVKLADLHKWQ